MTTTDPYLAKQTSHTATPSRTSTSTRGDASDRDGNTSEGPNLGLVKPQPLMGRATAKRFHPGSVLTGRRATSAARLTLIKLLGRMTSDSLTIEDTDGRIHRFGPHAPALDSAAASDSRPGIDRTDTSGERASGPLTATMTVTDVRAWLAVLREGSIGLGRGYIEGWWTTDDPMSVVRVIIRNLHAIDDVRNRINHLTGTFGDAARRAMPRKTRTRNREDIGAHYDLGNEFFELFLDETMTYSSAVFANDLSDLKDASLSKYDRLLSKLGVGSNHQVLEIGTGWGGMALRTAEERGATVTSTTVSNEQFDEAASRVAKSDAAEKIRLLNRDWRDLRGTFDRIVSIEMIEAVDWRDYGRFFRTIERCLAPDGMVGLQAICVPDRRYNRTKNTEDFIRRFVFPGGFLPSVGAITEALGRSTKLQLLDVEDFSGHYAHTLQLWRQRFENRLTDIQRLGLDDRFCRLWRFYLAYCEAGFRERHCTVNQLVLVGPDWRPDGLVLRPR